MKQTPAVSGRCTASNCYRG